MRRLLLSLLLLASPAHATTFSVTDDAGLTTANNTAQPGDVIDMAAATYTVGINPQNSGTAGNVITYKGVQSDPTGVIVSSINFNNYTSVKWVRSSGSIALGLNDHHDSLLVVSMRDSSSVFTFRGDNNVADSLDVICLAFHSVGVDPNFFPVTDWVQDNLVQNSQIYCSGRLSWETVAYLRSHRRNVWRRVRWYIRAQEPLVDEQMFGLYNVCNSQFYNCFWDIYNGKTGPDGDDNVKFAFNVRDQVAWDDNSPNGFLVMQACTLYVHSAQWRTDIILSNSGTENATGRNRFDSLLVIHDGPSSTYGSSTFFQNNARNDTVRYSVFVDSRRPPFGVAFGDDSTLIEHNTFVRLGSPGWAYWLYQDPFASLGDPHFSLRNIVYGTSPPSASRGSVTYNSNYDNIKNTESLYFGTGGDSLLAVKNSSGTAQAPSVYDTATPDSRWGDPAFAMPVAKMAIMDSVIAWVFLNDDRPDPFQPAAGSVALWSGWSNGYVGARSAATPDTERPGPIADFVAQSIGGDLDQSVRFTFTATGDDSVSGTASSYDLRYRTDAAVEDANWATSTLLSATAPQLAGESESFDINGFAPSSTYYFAIKAYDGTQYSALSNADTTLTQPVDTTAPATTSTLADSAAGNNNIWLTWTAPGDDADSGTATSYDIRYRTDGTITDGNWATSTQVTGEPTPLAAGSAQRLNVTALSSGTTYMFAMRTSDDVPNESEISNVVTSATTSGADVIRPAPITVLQAVALTSSTVQVQWQAVGDDSLSGVASAYLISHNTPTTVTEANFDANDKLLDIESGAPGSTETYIVTGLSPGTTYWFAVKTVDDAANISAISVTDSAIVPYVGSGGGGAEPPPPVVIPPDDPSAGSTNNPRVGVVVEGFTSDAFQPDVTQSVFRRSTYITRSLLAFAGLSHGIDYILLEPEQMKTQWVREGIIDRGNGFVDTLDAFIIVNWQGALIPSNGRIAYTNFRSDSLTLSGTSIYPQVPILFLAGAALQSVNQGGSAYSDWDAGGSVCSTGVAVSKSWAFQGAYTAYDYSAGTTEPFFTQGHIARAVLNPTAPAGGVRVLLGSSQSPAFVQLPAGAGVGPRQFAGWPDSLDYSNADTVSVWERPMAHITGAASLIFANPVGSSPCTDSAGTVIDCEGDIVELMVAMARLDSILGGTLIKKSTQVGLTIHGAYGSGASRYSGGLYRDDSTAFIATLDSLAARKIPAVIGFKLDSLAAFPEEWGWWSGRWPQTRFAPQWQSGTNASWVNPVDPFGEVRARTFYAGEDCAAAGDTSMYCLIRSAMWHADSAGFRVAKFALPANDDIGSWLDPADVDSFVYVLEKAGVKGILVNAQLGGDLNRQQLKDGVRLLGHTGHMISGTRLLHDARQDSIAPFALGAGSDSMARQPIPYREVHRAWSGIAFEKYRDYDVMPTDAFSNIEYEGVNTPIDDMFYGTSRAYVLKFHVNDFGGGTTPARRPAWIAIKSIDNAMNAINRLAGRSIVGWAYPEDITP